MICLIANSYKDAANFAFSHQLAREEWFHADSTEKVDGFEGFHVLVLPSAGSMPPVYFERLFRYAKERGRRNRK